MEELIITSNDGRMSSLEIAQITEREHKDVMRSIRNMEESWLKKPGAILRWARIKMLISKIDHAII